MENIKICNCKNVYYQDIVDALHSTTNFSSVLGAFDHVKDVTHCSTGCGGCYQKVLDVISKEMMR